MSNNNLTTKSSFIIIFIMMVVFNAFGQGNRNFEKEFNTIKGNIFPIIKVDGNGESDKSIKFTDENQPIFKKIAGDLLCFYGLDKGDNFALLTNNQIPNNVSIEDIDKISKENLLADVQNDLHIQKTTFGGLGFAGGGNHEAALILLPEVWSILVEKLGENIVFGIPSKDMSIFVSGDKIDDIFELQQMISDIHKNGERPLSKKLFEYRDGHIGVYGK